MSAFFNFRNKKDDLKPQNEPTKQYKRNVEAEKLVSKNKLENRRTVANENGLKFSCSQNSANEDFIKLWENCEEQQQSFKDYLSTIDDLLLEAIEVTVEYGMGSASLLQRRLRISYSRAARLIDIMEALNIVGDFNGSKRTVNITREQLKQVLNTSKFERISDGGKVGAYTTEKTKETVSAQKPVLDFENGLAFLYAKFGYHSINGMDGRTFEKFCANLLELIGFQNVKVTASSGNQGINILALRGGVKYAIQCKSYTSPLGNTAIQEVYAGKTFYDCHVGVVMTNSTFTAGAIELSKKTGVLLWDGKYIEAMLEFIAKRIRQAECSQ